MIAISFTTSERTLWHIWTQTNKLMSKLQAYTYFDVDKTWAAHCTYIYL